MRIRRQRWGGRGGAAGFPWAAAALVGLAGVSCRGGAPAEPAPSAALASSRVAQEIFRPLKQRFVGGDRRQRALLEANFGWFADNYPKDGLAPLARVYLALIAIDRGDVARARARLAANGSAAGGTTHDLAELVEGAIALTEKAPARALEHLLPLVGKLIDPYARMLLDESIVAAAIGAGRWYEAVAYMDLWLRDAPEESAAAVRAQVKARLEAVPSGALELMLQAMRNEATRAGYGPDIKKALVARLATVAIEQQDTELARRLVESSTSTQALGEAAEGLEELASSGGAPTVDGRTIGLVIATGKSQLGTRAADVLAGVVDALRLAGDGADRVRLTTRDEREMRRTDLALLALASQGASVLIAGLDPAQSEIAAAFAARTKIPVILLSPRVTAQALPGPAFLVGEASEKIAVALADSLAGHGARVVAPVGAAPPAVASPRISFLEAAPCDAIAAQAGESRFPIAAWRRARVDTLLLLGDTACAGDAIAEALAARLPGVRAAVTLEAADVATLPSRVPLLVAGAGPFPLKPSDTTSGMASYRRRHGRAPGFFTALGHDAAVLARAALRALPDDRTDDPGEVTRRHDAARAALAQAEADLFTTEARGFGGKNVLPRAIEVIEVR